MMKRLLIPFVFFVGVFQGCVNSALEHDDTHREKLPRALTSAEQELIASGNTFSFEIFDKVVASDPDKNVFISPLSISMALGMTLNGAEGATRAGIKQTLGMREMDLQSINQSYQSLIKLLVELDPKVEMSIGNSLWGRKGFAINQSFKDSLTTYFNARVNALDFSDPAAADVINNWVSEQTSGRIEKIIEGRIDPLTMLYLINTVYFKGDWLYQFDPGNTRPADFHLQDGSTVQVDMMSQKLPLATYRSGEVQMAELAYGDSLYKMTLLMPGNRETSIDTFVQQSLTAPNLKDWTRQLKTAGDMRLKLPKFENSYKKKLNEILKDMGMDEAFDEKGADFSKINLDAPLYISKVMHKANITVDEEGSEAAAATSVAINLTSAAPSFRVNRPFVYLIRERISGTVLFMGVMKNPEL